MKNKIRFNKAYITGKEAKYLGNVLEQRTSGNGIYTKKCHQFFSEKYGFNKCLLTHSCTAALEMAALLIDIKKGDEVIAPSYTFVSTVNPFVLRGAKIKFAESCSNHPNVDPESVKSLITDKTKAIVIVHYAGVACNMDAILSIVKENNLFLIEDAAHAIDSFYKGKPLGSFGHLSAFSFHETKNVSSGEGGMLVINDKQFNDRADLIWEKGTNRLAFQKGEVEKYEWLDVGSSFLPSEFIAAMLYSQLESLTTIQTIRKEIWNSYYDGLVELENDGLLELPKNNKFATQNGHMFYLIMRSKEERTLLIEFLNERGVQAIFHYLPLHISPFFKSQHDTRILKNAEHFSDCIVRVPFHCHLTNQELAITISEIKNFFLGNC